VIHSLPLREKQAGNVGPLVRLEAWCSQNPLMMLAAASCVWMQEVECKEARGYGGIMALQEIV
jgi:hypothetical protein